MTGGLFLFFVNGWSLGIRILQVNALLYLTSALIPLITLISLREFSGIRMKISIWFWYFLMAFVYFMVYGVPDLRTIFINILEGPAGAAIGNLIVGLVTWSSWAMMAWFLQPLLPLTTDDSPIKITFVFVAFFSLLLGLSVLVPVVRLLFGVD